MEVTYDQASKHIEKTLLTGLVPILKGSPGLGKSTLIKDIAKKFNLFVIDLRLSQCDPTDLLGFPTVDKERNKAGYVPMDTFPIEGDKIPKGYGGWLLFLDEFNAASKAVEIAAYKLILDKQVGQFNLHKNVAIVAAGNLSTDNAIVNDQSTAMASRLVHFTVKVDHAAWIKWASSNGIDHRIISYINYRPEILHNFQPDSADETFPCPRTWEFLSKLIKKDTVLDPNDIPIYAGTVGEGTAREFYGFSQIFESLPKLSDIVATPYSLAVPGEPSTLYAISGLIANNLDENNSEELMAYLARLPAEFNVVALRMACRRDPSIFDLKGVQDWMRVHPDRLL